MKKETTTSSFGVSKRENHNSDKFYSSNLYDGIIIHEAEDKTINLTNKEETKPKINKIEMDSIEIYKAHTPTKESKPHEDIRNFNYSH